MAAAKAHPADDILRSFDRQGSADAAHPADEILQSYPSSPEAPVAANDPYPTSDNADVIAAMRAAESRFPGLDPLKQQFSNPLEAPPGYTYGNIIPWGIGPNGQSGPAVPNALMDAYRAFNRQTTNPDPSTQAEDALAAIQPVIGGSVVPGIARFPSRANRLAAESDSATANRLLAAPTETPMAMPAASPAGAPVASAPVSGANPLVTAAPAEASANRLTAPASPTAPAESIVTPTEGPTPKLLPVRTPAQADAEADRILRHFAGNGSTTINQQEIIPGSKQTLSRAIEGGNPGIAGLESRIAEQFPNDFVALDKKNQTDRSAHFDALAGSEADVRAASGERDAAFQAADRAVFDPANVKPTDPSPVIAQIDQVLAGREGQRSTVASALKDVRAKLVDDKGNLQTDPDLLYGVRKSINDDIAPAAKGTANDKTQAARELIEVRNALDPVIEAGAPGFTKFIGDYSAASAPIDGMKYLQGMKLTDTQGNITLQKLDTAIKSLERIQALPGARAGDGVSAEQLAGLHALREDMRLDAKRQLGKAVGSNTVQNLGTNRVLSTLGHPLVGATGIGGSIANPWFGIPAMAARYALQKAGDKGQEMVFEALRRKLLNPQDASSAFQPPK